MIPFVYWQDLRLFATAVSPASVWLRFERGDLKCSTAFLDTLSRFKLVRRWLSNQHATRNWGLVDWKAEAEQDKAEAKAKAKAKQRRQQTATKDETNANQAASQASPQAPMADAVAKERWLHHRLREYTASVPDFMKGAPFLFADFGFVCFVCAACPDGS